jgi:hypothetical protein
MELKKNNAELNNLSPDDLIRERTGFNNMDDVR